MLIMVGERTGRGMIGILARVLSAQVLSRFMSQKMVTFLARPIPEDLNIMRELMASGKVIPVIDRCYSLREVLAAVRYLGEGHARGKVVISLEFNNEA